MSTITDLTPAGAVLDPATRLAITAAASESLSASTRRSYDSAWRSWLSWCSESGHIALGADPATVAAYLVHLADRGLTPSSLDRALAAIRNAHLDAHLEDPTTNRGLARVRSGLRRRLGTAPRRQAHPLTTDQVRQIVTTLDPASLRGARDAAIILLGYAAALRRSELAGLAVKDVLHRAAGLVLVVRRSKGDQEGAGQYVGVTRGEHPLTDPVGSVDRWVAMTGAKGSDPLFVPISWSDRRPGVDPMSGAAIGQVISDRADAAGLGHLNITGHSLRAGHATTAAEAGVPAEKLARTTRHQNLATLATYTRPAETLRDTTSSALGL
ncbi:tyrosine-type recombinase/integrase [Ornithinimicrobium murale]|uniref:tyrosine-type recombinase/integrase n=1 Tax=Ornithinimicrobium murale TaxID=1050153 RepID=UPI000E0DB3AF|nr:tyrosine-type recombinase/integrase [Ornithinimicrobium murale]